MRRLICHLVLLLCGAAQTQAEGLRVTTWNLNWFPSGSPDLAIPAVEAQRISEVASVLRGLSPDVIVLQEVRDWDTCEQLAQCLGGDAYRVLICSSFKDGQNNVPGKRQIALLSRFPAESSWSQEWQVQGAQKPPGGYVFAAVRAGGAIVGIFGVHLKNNLVQGNPEREAQFNIFKRELSAAQLVEDIEQVQKDPRIQIDALIVAGNFNTCPDQSTFVSESTLTTLRSAQFSDGYEGLPLIARVTAPGHRRYPDATFDYIFVRNTSFEHPPLITSSKLSDHFPVTGDLAIRAKPVLALVDQAAGAPLKVESSERPWLWVFPLVALAIAGIWHGQRQKPVPAVMLPVPGISISAETVSRAETAGKSIDASVWQTQTARAERRAQQATAVVRAGLIPHLARLMADKLVRRLIWQRSRLVETQRLTAAHVADLEQRLGQLQPKLQARLDAYEKRIAELECELEASRRHPTKA